MKTFKEYIEGLQQVQVPPQMAGNLTPQVTPQGLNTYGAQISQKYVAYLKELQGMWNQLPIQSVEQIMQFARQGHQSAAQVNKPQVNL